MTNIKVEGLTLTLPNRVVIEFSSEAELHTFLIDLTTHLSNLPY